VATTSTEPSRSAPPDAAGPDRPVSGSRPRWRSIPGAVRLASHAAVWTGILVPMFAELSRGWRPFDDDAAIASRAYQALSLHPPLTGLVSAASGGTGHILYDPGPLLFYLLAVPVHVDPAHGLFWGAALFCGVVLSLAIEAAWSLGAWVIGAAVGFCVLDLAWLTPGVFENLPWNAYFPLPFFIAALVLAWAVAMGRTRWWPVLVVAASVAAQSHLIFDVPAVALVVLAMVFGLLPRGQPRRYGWLVVGLFLGLLCWLAPLIQELGKHPNLTALIRSGRGQQTLGMSFGLRMVGLAGDPHAIWLTHIPSGFYKMVAFEYYGHAPWYGGVILGLLVVITVWAFVTGRRMLGALGAVSVATTAGIAVSFGVFPYKNLISLAYLVNCVWVVGILVWSVVAWAAVEVARAVLSRAHGPALTDDQTPRGSVSVIPSAGALVVAALVLVGLAGLRPAATRPTEVDWSASDVALVAQAATAIERAVPSGPVTFEIGPGFKANFFLVAWATEALAYRLESDGWRPGVIGPAEYYTGLAVPPGAQWPSFQVTLQGTRVVSVTRVG